MPEDMPVRKSIHVMVGIAQSKVFVFNLFIYLFIHLFIYLHAIYLTRTRGLQPRKTSVGT